MDALTFLREYADQDPAFEQLLQISPYAAITSIRNHPLRESSDLLARIADVQSDVAVRPSRLAPPTKRDTHDSALAVLADAVRGNFDLSHNLVVAPHQTARALPIDTAARATVSQLPANVLRHIGLTGDTGSTTPLHVESNDGISSHDIELNPIAQTVLAPGGQYPIKTPEGWATVELVVPGQQDPYFFQEEVYIWPYTNNGVRSWLYTWTDLQRANFLVLPYPVENSFIRPIGDVYGHLDTALFAGHLWDEDDPTSDMRYLLAPEAQFYARDPDELGQSLESYINNPPHPYPIYTNHSRLRAQVAGTDINEPVAEQEGKILIALARMMSMPKASAIVSPTNGAEYTLLTGEGLYGSYPQNAAGPASVSNGDIVGVTPSVRAVRLSLPGLCTNEQRFDALFKTSGSSLNLKELIRNAIVSTGGCNRKTRTLFVDELIVLPIIRHQSGSPTDSRMQIFLHVSAYAQDTSYALDCHVIGDALYDVGLDEQGRFTVEPVAVTASDAGGSGCSDLDWVEFAIPVAALFDLSGNFPGGRTRMRWTLAAQIPYSIEWNLRAIQGCISTGKCDPQLKLLVDTGAIQTHACNPDNDIDLCRAARDEMCNRVRAGFRAAPAPWGGVSGERDDIGCPRWSPYPHKMEGPDDARLQMLLRTVNDLTNWQCLNSDHGNLGLLPISDNNGNCVFMPPIKRFALNQDSVQVVFYDDTNPSNAGLAMSYALIGLDSTKFPTIGTAASPTPLCNYTRNDDGHGVFARDPSVFLAEHICFCPTPDTPGADLFDPHALERGDYYHICPCDDATTEHFGICCASDDQNCHGECANTQTDPRHCGDCDTDCGDGACIAGQCIPNATFPPPRGNWRFNSHLFDGG